MGTLKIIKQLEGQAIFEITPTFKVKGETINYVTIINVSGTELIASPCDPEGNPIEGTWQYTAEGTTMEALYELIVRLKNINNNTKERHA
jgi:hypothetical protein